MKIYAPHPVPNEPGAIVARSPGVIACIIWSHGCAMGAAFAWKDAQPHPTLIELGEQLVAHPHLWTVVKTTPKTPSTHP